MSLGAFWRRNLAFSKLAIVSNIEYRLNFLVDAIAQPCISSVVEVVLWMSIFKGSGLQTIGGYSQENYIAYVLWGVFIARISTSWMYEFRMIEEVDSGAVNSVIVRPMSFYEYYLSQLMGYKLITTIFSISVPLTIFAIYKLPFHWERLPLALLLVFYYLIFVHSISFIISCLAFFLNRAYSFTAAKNLGLWLVSGELFPLDLLPEPYRSWVINLPFSSAVYVPTGYLTGRVEIGLVGSSFVSITIGIIVANLFGLLLWKRGLKSYVGTGA